MDGFKQLCEGVDLTVGFEEITDSAMKIIPVIIRISKIDNFMMFLIASELKV
jgi:hypothetical protein